MSSIGTTIAGPSFLNYFLSNVGIDGGGGSGGGAVPGFRVLGFFPVATFGILGSRGMVMAGGVTFGISISGAGIDA